MIYTCYVYRNRSDVPFLDVIDVESVRHAVQHCRSLLAERPNSTEAHLYQAATPLRIIPFEREHQSFDRGLSDDFAPSLG